MSIDKSPIRVLLMCLSCRENYHSDIICNLFISVLSNSSQQLFLLLSFWSSDINGSSIQRTASLGSIGSLDSNSSSLRSFNSGNQPDAVPEPEQATGEQVDRMPTFPQLSASESCGSLDHFKAPAVPESDASASSPIDLFQMPAASPASSINLFEEPLNSSPSLNAYQTAQTSLPSSIDLFGGIAQQQSVSSLDQNSLEPSVSKNEGWATFHTQRAESTAGIGNLMPSVIPSNAGSSAKLDQVSSLDTGMQWPPLQNSIAHGSVPGPWNDSLHNLQASSNTSSAQVTFPL